MSDRYPSRYPAPGRAKKPTTKARKAGIAATLKKIDADAKEKARAKVR